MLVSRVTHAGKTLLDLAKEERVVHRAFWGVEVIADITARAEAISKLMKALDTIRERRRILLGEPLPGTRARSDQRKPMIPAQFVDVEAIPQAQLEPGPAISPVQPTGPA